MAPKPLRCLFGWHRYQTLGVCGIVALVSRCARCGRGRILHALSMTYTIIPAEEMDEWVAEHVID